MKILGGYLKGQTIEFTPEKSVRPTQNKVRQALFNVLGDYVRDKQVLDIFSGSGALGFESLSRGALSVTFIEQDRVRCDLIKKSAQRLGLVDKVQIVCLDFENAMELIGRRVQRFDLVVADPPYGWPQTRQLPLLLARKNIFSLSGAFMALECSTQLNIDSLPDQMSCVKTTNYGTTQVLFYKIEPKTGEVV